MRDDLSLALRRGGINVETLSAIQRILLTTDGTITDVLEAHCREPMSVVALRQERIPSPRPMAELAVGPGEDLLDREILLRGSVSGRVVTFAHTYIVIDRLDANLRQGLLEQKLAIGHLLLRDRLETYREIVGCGREPCGELAQHFGLFAAAPLLFRTYLVLRGGRPIMQITEKFPEWGM